MHPSPTYQHHLAPSFRPFPVVTSHTRRRLPPSVRGWSSQVGGVVAVRVAVALADVATAGGDVSGDVAVGGALPSPALAPGSSAYAAAMVATLRDSDDGRSAQSTSRGVSGKAAMASSSTTWCTSASTFSRRLASA